MYCSVVPAFGSRAARQPEELLDGTGDDVVVVSGVVVGVATEAEAEAEEEADVSGANNATANALNIARTESAGGRWRTERARLS
jgi:hypothetical protein